MSMSTESDYLCKGALDGEELFTIEDSENWRSTPDNLEERDTCGKKGRKTHSSSPLSIPATRVLEPAQFALRVPVSVAQQEGPQTPAMN